MRTQKMANRRCLDALTRYFSLLSSPLNALPKSKTLTFSLQHAFYPSHSHLLKSLPSIPCHKLHSLNRITSYAVLRHFSSPTRDSDNEEGEEEGEEEKDEEGEISEEDADDTPASNCAVKRADLMADKAEEAAAIGYKVIGPLSPSEQSFKPWKPVFAVVQIGSHQFKVSNGDTIYTERLKHCEVNDKLILNRVLLLGSKTQTIIGRPTLPNAAVHAVVEEHALDAKVIIFKKKRRKNYRRTKGHRQELTRLRITDIQGIGKRQWPKKAAVAV